MPEALVFGTYETDRAPRVTVLAEGLAAHGYEVSELRTSLGLDPDERLRILHNPKRLPIFAWRVLRAWLRLLRGSRRQPRPDLVVIGYMGHFDVHLARLRFRRSTVALDHLVGAADTARDRRSSSAFVDRVLEQVDRAAIRASDLVIVDTEDHEAMLPRGTRSVVVPVGAPHAWFRHDPPAGSSTPMRVVFFGLFTPLQGTPCIAEALRLVDAPIEVTMVGTGQDHGEVVRLLEHDPRVIWHDWLDPADLIPLVQRHDVCLGIFGTSPKGRRVVPQKVYQGAAAGCAIVTSDTGPQRQVLEGIAELVPPGNAEALASCLNQLARSPERLASSRRAAWDLARSRFTPAAVTRPLVQELEDSAATSTEGP